MTLLLIIIVGGIIGWLASKVMGTDPEQGILANIIVGIVGALIGGFLANLLGITEDSIISGDFSIVALLISFVGALLAVWIWKMIRRKT